MRILLLKHQSEKGVVLYYVAALTVVMLLFAGLAIDLGRGYIVKMQLTKAVDGAALAAGRALGAGASVVPKTEAQQIFTANFPTGFMGVTSVTDPTTDPNFYNYVYDAAKGANIYTIRASAVLPTTFMRIAGVSVMNVASAGQATRKLVDLALALDVSGSIAPDWSQVSAAAADFVDSFDEVNDRMALIVYSNGGKVLDQINSPSRGFSKTTIKNHITGYSPAGSTAMAEAVYRAYDELEVVPAASQSGMRVLVLFTDGCANGVPGNYTGLGSTGAGIPATSSVLATNDDGTGMFGLTDTLTFAQTSFYTTQAYNNLTSLNTNFPGGNNWAVYQGITLRGLRYMPIGTTHGGRRSATVPAFFPMQTNAINVDGAPQSAVRGLDATYGDATKWEANRRNVNNAARNLVEIISNDARNRYAGSTIAPFPIRVYSIGMGPSLTTLYGWRHELGSDLLKRVANDPASADHNSNQLDGRYFFAPNAASVHTAFAELKSELLRLSQ
jgi:Flp pilus assembly protein TadG